MEKLYNRISILGNNATIITVKTPISSIFVSKIINSLGDLLIDLPGIQVLSDGSCVNHSRYEFEQNSIELYIKGKKLVDLMKSETNNDNYKLLKSSDFEMVAIPIKESEDVMDVIDPDNIISTVPISIDDNDPVMYS